MLIIVCTLLTLLSAALLIARMGLLIVTVDGNSMSPTLRPGDNVLIVRRWLAGRPRKGQIVMLAIAHASQIQGSNSRGEKLYIKRVVASGGESFTATLCANALPATDQGPSQWASWHIPRNYIFVCGDNREESIDSRSWGPLALKSVAGTVVMKLSSSTPRGTV